MDFSRFSGKRICVAVSGGVDSMSLLHYAKTLENRCGFSLSAVHCEHGIRGVESLADAAFVKETCEKWGIPLFSFSEDCPQKAEREKCSLETAARNFRYDCFSALISQDKADFIATAHHSGDEAETVLFRLARGTSLSGAQGIAKERGIFIRPFLDWTRSDIEEYAKRNGINYRVDKTNFEREATRNKIRLDVLPVLENAVPGAQKNLCRFAQLIQEDDELLYAFAKELVEGNEEQVEVRFCDKKPIFTRACLCAMKALGVTHDYTQIHLENCYALQQSERGSLLCLPGGLQAKKMEKAICFFYPKEEIFPEKPTEKIFDKNGFDGGRYAVNVYFSPLTVMDNGQKILRIDAQKMPKDAVFRFRKEGDEICVYGGGTKTLKKFFNEKKTPVEERAYIPLIAQKDGKKVYAVCGIEIADDLKITKETKEIIYITTEKKEVEL